MRFAGVLVSGVDPDFFTTFFANIFALRIPHVAILVIGDSETAILEIVPAEPFPNACQKF